MTDAFYIADGDRYLSQVHTRGPWSPDLQHAGPPGALLARAVEAHAEGLQLVRLGIDLIKPVPIAPLRVQVTERTGGKRRRILEAELLAADDNRLLARAQALLLRSAELSLPQLPQHDPAPPRPPEDCALFAFEFHTGDIGYHTAMELRLESGGPGSGCTRMWLRPRLPLVAGEPTSPCQRLLLVADSGNGVSMVLDPREFAFSNPDLSVNLRRPPRGDWLCLDAITHIQSRGLGMAESRLWDRDGVVANGNQNLLVRPQPET